MHKDERMMLARDLVQARILGAIFAGQIRNELALKGGFAMRVLMASERHTKDIDLVADPTRISPARIKSRILSALRPLVAAKLIDKMPEEFSKDSDTTIRLKVAGKVGQSEYNLTIEISQRDAIDDEHIRRKEVTHSTGFRYVVDCIDPESIAVTKLDCLGNPNREAPRDLYDLAVLISMEVKPPHDLLKRLDAGRLENLKEGLWDKIQKMDYAMVQTQLLPFLPKAAADRLTPEAWEEMQLKVAYTVEDWIRDLDPKTQVPFTLQEAHA